MQNSNIQDLANSCCENQKKKKIEKTIENISCFKEKYEQEALLLHILTAEINNKIITGVLYV